MIKIVHTLPDLHVGGVSSLLKKLLFHFNDENFEHHLCYFGPNREELKNFTLLNVKIHEIPYKGWADIYRTSSLFCEMVKAYNIDIIHNHLFLDRLITSLSFSCHRLPIITTIHTTNTIERKNSFKEKIIKLTEDALARLTTKRFISVSNIVKEVAIEDRYVKEDKITTIYSGVEIPVRIIRENAPQDKIKIIAIGRLIESKGFGNAIKIIERCREKGLNVHLTILGDGPLRTELEAMVKSKKLTPYISFVGFVDNVQDYLKESDIYISCSLEEGFGLSLVEAMSYSLPIVAFDIPIFREISGKENSLILVEKSDVENFAKALSSITNDSNKFKETSDKVYSSALLNYDIGVMAQKYKELYSEVIQD